MKNVRPLSSCSRFHVQAFFVARCGANVCHCRTLLCGLQTLVGASSAAAGVAWCSWGSCKTLAPTKQRSTQCIALSHCEYLNHC
jgi:hypothetical protein